MSNLRLVDGSDSDLTTVESANTLEISGQLELLVEAARRGELRSVGLVAVYDDGALHVSYVADEPLEVLGGITELQRRIGDSMVEVEYEPV